MRHVEVTGAFLAQVPRVILSREELNAADLDHRDYFLISLMDGHTTVENVLDISGMPPEEALALLESLVRRGIIEVDRLRTIERAMLRRGACARRAAMQPFDPVAATRLYLDSVPADAHARSDAYFEGGYWLILVGFLATSAISLLLLHTGQSAKMRDRARKISGVRFVQSGIYWLQYFIATTILGIPLGIYTDFVREHSYGLSNMTFGAWTVDQVKGLGVGVVFGAILVPVLYLVIARARQTWWLWGTLLALAFAAFGSLIGPVFISPLFNQYTPVADQTVRSPILSLARANGIPATEVWQFDASRQSDRVSANVSGLFGTERISLNDNLLKRCSLPEIEAVMSHEMGHYVLHHVVKGLVDIGLVIVVGFALVRFGFERLRKRFAERWKVEGIDDPAGLPLALLLFGALRASS